MALQQIDTSLLVTFNKITKLCTDKILLEPDGSPANVQWHRFQLVKMAKILGVDTTDSITGATKGRVELGKVINEYLLLNPEVAQHLYLEPEYQQYGLVPQKTTVDSSNNLGGNPGAKLRLTHGGIDLEFIPDESPTLSKIQRKVKERRSDDKVCVRGGPLWFENKCYLDCLIMVLLQSDPNNNFRNIFLDKLREVVDTSGISPEGRVAAEILKLDQEFIDYQIKPLTTLTKLLGQVKKLSLAEVYTTNTPQDSKEALSNLLTVAGLNYQDANIYDEWYAATLDGDISSENTSGYGTQLTDPESHYQETIQSANWEYKPDETCLILQDIPLKAILDHVQPTPVEFSTRDLLNIQIDSELPEDFVKTEKNWDYHPGDKTFTYTDSTGEVYVVSADEYMLDDEIYYYTGEDNIITSDGIINVADQLGTTKFSRHIIRHQISHPDFLIMAVRREIGVGEPILTNVITPIDTIVTTGGKSLSLHATVCYQGHINNGHYYSYYQCDGSWYQYNDVECEITKIGSHDQLVSREDVLTQSCILFYQPK